MLKADEGWRTIKVGGRFSLEVEMLAAEVKAHWENVNIFL